MAVVSSLGMSKTKDDLLRHLNMASETYNMMAKEAETYYKWLTEDEYHLKDNCKRKPPYDWSDINEKSKDEAIRLIAQSGDAHTAYYWDLGRPADVNSPNWIAKWFLYHKFRYRDGRNRNPPSRGDHQRGSHHHRSHHRQTPSAGSNSYYDPQTHGSMNSVSPSQSYYSTAESSTSASYTTTYDTSTSNYTQNTQDYGQYDDQSTNSYYDPVRDQRT